jgi:hypothetical protein
MVETKQQMKAINPPLDLPTPSTREWMTSWVGMPSLTKHANLTKHHEVPSTFPSKTTFVKGYFLRY